MTRLRTAWAAAPLALLMACGAGDDDVGTMCRMTGAPSAIIAVVEPPLTDKARIVRLTACWEHCEAGTAGLVRAEKPEVSRRGVVLMPGLPAEEVEVTAVVQRRDGTEIHRAVRRTTPVTMYPNGNACGAHGNQGSIRLP